MGKKRHLNILCPFERFKLKAKYCMCVCMITTFVGGCVFFVLKIVMLDNMAVKLIYTK
jgi:hypothetical protein